MLRPCAPIRILYVIIGVNQGGTAQALLNLTSRLDRQRFHPMVCPVENREVMGVGKEMAALGTEVLPLGHVRQPVRTVRALVRLIRERHIDVIDGLDPRSSWYARTAGVIARVPVRISHEQSVFHHRRWQHAVRNRLLEPVTDGFIAVSHAMKQQLVEWYGYPADKIEVIYNGVDTDRFCPPPSRREAKQRLGLDPERTVIGIVARLDPDKGYRCFLEAVQRLRHTVDAVFLAVGSGRPDHERQIRREADDRGVSDVVQFLGGRRDVPDCLAAFDVYVLPTVREGGPPISVLEAMATGCPVVVSDHPAMMEAVEDGRNGFVVPMRDPEMLAKRVETLVRDSALRARLGADGRRTIETQFSVERFVQHTSEYYDRLWTNRRRGRG